MATLRVPRLAPVTARDGVDTRTKENSVTAAAESEETTHSGAGDRGYGSSTAILGFEVWLTSQSDFILDLVAPAGAEVEGAPIWGAWGEYETVVQRRIENSDESFRWVDFATQMMRAEAKLLECVPEVDQMLMFHINALNRARTSLADAIARARRELPSAPYLLDYHKSVVVSWIGYVAEAEYQLNEVCPAIPPCGDCGQCDAMEGYDVCEECYQTREDAREGYECGWVCGADCKSCVGVGTRDAGKTEETWVGPPPPIRIPSGIDLDCDSESEVGTCECGEREYIEGLCADCYWEEDARIKRERRRTGTPSY